MTKQEQFINWDFNPITGKNKERNRYASENYGNYKKPNQNARATWGGKVNEDNLSQTLHEIRWKGAKIVPNYKFEGTIPEPKDITYYQNHTGVDTYK